MPAVVGAIAGAVVASWVEGVVVGGVVTAVMGKVAGSLAGAVVSSFVTGALSDRPASSGQDALARGILINTGSNIEPIPVIYGRRRVGGAVAAKAPRGTSNLELHKVVVLCEGEIGNVQNVYFDDVLSTDARFSGCGAATVFYGSDGQAASAALIAAFPGLWTADHKLSGIAYLHCGFTWVSSVFQGEPTVTADVLGKVLYDPRSLASRWHHNPALAIRDYLTNARYGRGIASARIDEASFSAAANACEERVDVPAHTADFTAAASTDVCTFSQAELFGWGDGVTVSSTGTLPAGLAPATTYYVILMTDDAVQLAASYDDAIGVTAIDITDAGSGTHTMHHVDAPRYTCDGLVNPDESFLVNLQNLLKSCRGTVIFSGGVYKLLLDQAQSATSFAFTEDNITGAWVIQLAGKRSRYNRVKARYFNPAARWQPDIAVWEDATLRSDYDNGALLEETIDLPCCANVYRSRTIAQAELKQSRYGTVCQFTALPIGLRAEVGDVVPITHSTPGWTAKAFRIVEMELLANGEVKVTAREYNAAVYTTDALTALDLVPDTNLPDPMTPTVGAPSGVTLAETSITAVDGTVLPSVVLSWTASTDATVTGYEAQGKLSTSSDWVALTLTEATRYLLAPTYYGRGLTYQARVRAVNLRGFKSAWVAAGDLTTGVVAPPTGLSLASAVTVNADGTVAGEMTATWTASSSTDVSGYEVQAKLDGLTDWASLSVAGSATTYRHPVLPGATYNVRVRALSSSGVGSAWTATANATIAADTTAPGAPSALAATGSVRAIRLAWVNPSDTDWAATEVWEHTADVRASAAKIATVRASAYDRVALPAGANTRYYWVRALDFSGNVGAWNASAGVSAATTEISSTDGATVLAAKLNSTAADTLAGTISIAASSSAGLKVGTITWDGSGNLTGGTGVALTTNGIVAALSGVAKLVLKADGTATFAGALSAASGTFAGDVDAGGHVTAIGSGVTDGTNFPGSGGSVALGGYNNSTGAGVYGRTTSGLSFGVYGRSESSSSPGVQGSNTSTGYGVYSAGKLGTDNQIVSSLATGTAPLSITSTTRVANLNVATAGDADQIVNSGHTTTFQGGATGASHTAQTTFLGNKPGSGDTDGNWMKIVIDGNTYYVPYWA